MSRRGLAGPALCAIVVLLIYAGMAPAGAQSSDTIVVAQTVDIQSGDPYKTALTTSYNVLTNVYDTLINRDVNFKPVPGLATSWRAVDPTTWEFKLRHGVLFHDGEPFNASVVKFSLDRAFDPKIHWGGIGYLRPIKSVEVVDDYTVRLHTEQPWPLLPSYVGYYFWMVPPQYLAQNGDDALVRHPIGTGPYKFVQWTRDDRVELIANNDFWGGKPKIAHLVFRVIPTDAGRLAELLAGSVDMIPLVPPEAFDPIRNSPRTKLVFAKSTTVYFFLFNLLNIPSTRPLADKRVREALNYAVDRNLLNSGVMRNAATPIATFCSDVSFGCDKSIIGYPYDPARARTLLKEAGYANGFDMTVITPSGAYPGDRDLSLALADQLKNVGVRVHVEVREYGLLLSQVLTRTLPGGDAVFLRFSDLLGYAGAIPATAFENSGSSSYWNDPEFDQLIDAAKNTLDETAARKLYRQAQVLFENEAPAITLFTAPAAYGMRKNLQWTPRTDFRLKMFPAALQ